MVSISRVVRGLLYERQWGILVLRQSLEELLSGVAPAGDLLLAPEVSRFWADPFPHRDANGTLWIFVEEMHRWRGLGRIVALRIHEGRVAQRVEVLASAHHFSFPQIHSGLGTGLGFAWLATVQTCDPSGQMYGFNRPGDPWTPVARYLPAGVIDPALALPTDPESGDWLLTGATGSDEFAGFRQWRAQGGQGWREEVELRFRDEVLARPAGNADLIRGLRSAQDCQGNYGMATSLLDWDPALRGPGQLRLRLAAEDFDLGALGTHTLSWTPDGFDVVADVWRRRRQPASGIHRLLELRHVRNCAGRAASLAMA